MKRKIPLYEKVGHEIINETITIGLSLLIIVLGFNYFNLKYAWVKIIGSLSTQAQLTGTQFYQEITLMLSGVANVFPFKYLLGQYSLVYGLIFGTVILGIGIGLKLLTRPSKDEFIRDMGRNIYVPALVGFFSLIILQIMIAFSASQTITQQLSDPFFVWFTYGELILIGITALILGSVVKIIAKAQGSAKIRLIGNTLLYGSYIAIVFYGFIRLISLKVLLNSDVGGYIKMFVLSGDVSVFIIIFCIFMFTFGVEIKRYGEMLKLHSKKEEHLDVFPPLFPQ
ncbi:MAG: hypothetical protein KKH52_00585 [Nanoarchaeota archaeon]|nr:hypothetical protein [Nanoarchaeota archaeon]MBU1623145.1 hypothetical protein [Nanoarchaeota archaeon]MBU1973872.1 hypothetical protein [Nanoarchaeota archaeon]